MLYNRLQIANKIALRTFIKYHWFDPRTRSYCPDNYFPMVDKPWTDEETKAVMGVYRKTKKFCSNPFCGCGNPRRRRGTHNDEYRRHEIRANDKLKSE